MGVKGGQGRVLVKDLPPLIVASACRVVVHDPPEIVKASVNRIVHPVIIDDFQVSFIEGFRKV